MAAISASTLQHFHARLAVPTTVRTTDVFRCPSPDCHDRTLSQNQTLPFTVLSSVDSQRLTMKANIFGSGFGACAASSTIMQPPATLLREDSTQPTTFDDVLRVPSTVSDDEIKAAFRRIAKKVHPDHAPPDRMVEYQRKFIVAQKAYSVLKDPCRRSLYDYEISHTLCGSQLRAENWRKPLWRGSNRETDQCWTS